ncbi:beta-glucuronidase [Virgibacillus xinjiangensis]|uniref:Beta-glucuronidase n=1 Tax=Virgibacillus xinjiangensis TaxID=393090 RepID=A0ABV7CSG1_9BACI
MANELLYPKHTLTRSVVSLDGMWKFKWDPASIGEKENWQSGLQHTEWVPVPSSFNDLFTDKDSREYAGDFWYEREFFVSSDWKDKDLDVRFGCATHKAVVYVNGKQMTSHVGGFLPFNASINDVVEYDAYNRIVVKINNELDATTLPVGKSITLKNGKKMVKPFFDFFNYAGLQRSVSLVITPKESIIDFTVKHELKGEDALVHYDVETTGEHPVEIEVYDESSHLVAVQTGKQNTIEIKQANLWRPLDAYLYCFRVLIKDKETIIDEYEEEIGIRTVEVKGDKFYINEEEVYLTGYGKHMDFDVIGRGMDPVVMKRDFELIKWSGANSFRTAHYPYDELFYQMADREGIVIIDEVAAVGFLESTKNFLDAAGGKVTGFFNYDIVHQETKKNHKNDMYELIQRDKNHASVCIWSLLNEPDTLSERATGYFEEIFDYAWELDVQKRPRTFASIGTSIPGKCNCYQVCDIVSLNRYYGWYFLNGFELSDAEAFFHQEMELWQDVGKPVIFTEYGTDTVNGLDKLPSVMWSETYQKEYYDLYHRMFDYYDCVVGEQVWNFADFQTVEGKNRMNGNKKGIFTRSRQPKPIAYLLKERWEALAGVQEGDGETWHLI